MYLTERKKGVIISVAVSLAAIALPVFVGVILRTTLTSLREDPDAQAIADKSQKGLEQQFRELPSLSQAVVIQDGSMHKIYHGVVSATYKTQKSYEAIKTHYQHELTSRGWVFKKEDAVLYDRTDYGGKELVYCKNGYGASLQYAGRQETEFGWTFSFGMTWGSVADECK